MFYAAIFTIMKTVNNLHLIWMLFGGLLLNFISTEGRSDTLKSSYFNLVSQKVPSIIDLNINVNANGFIRTVDERFLSIAIDTGILANRKQWKEFNVSSKLLQTLSRELSPAFLRFGGTASNYLIFNGSVKENCYQHDADCNYNSQFSKSYNDSNIYMTGNDWMMLNKFCTAVNWILLFDLNALLRKHGVWNSTNAISLLKFNSNHGYHVAWELGNELNSHNQVSGHQLGKDFLTLRRLLNDFPASKHSLLVGPDISSSHKSALDFLHAFLKEAAPVLDGVTFHQYSLNGHNSTLQDFLNVKTFDALNITINQIYRVVNHTMPRPKLWLGETGTAYGGGAPGLSDTYVSGFLWLDKLGLSALRGIDVVIRQSFMFGHYGLITSDMQPLPDYWLNVLYKWLVGPRVLQVTTKDPSDRKSRVYAHCTTFGKLYSIKGAITVFVINLHNATLNVTFSSPGGTVVHEYILAPHGTAGLTSRLVSLNGNQLKLLNGTFPKFSPKIVDLREPVVIPPFTFGFFVLPKANAKACSGK